MQPPKKNMMEAIPEVIEIRPIKMIKLLSSLDGDLWTGFPSNLAVTTCGRQTVEWPSQAGEQRQYGASE